MGTIPSHGHHRRNDWDRWHGLCLRCRRSARSSACAACPTLFRTDGPRMGRTPGPWLAYELYPHRFSPIPMTQHWTTEPFNVSFATTEERDLLFYSSPPF